MWSTISAWPEASMDTFNLGGKSKTEGNSIKYAGPIELRSEENEYDPPSGFKSSIANSSSLISSCIPLMSALPVELFSRSPDIDG